MRRLGRALLAVVVALSGVVALVVSSAVTAAVQLLATTALIMGGTQHPLAGTDSPEWVSKYLRAAETNYITPSGVLPGYVKPVNNTVAVVTPEEFWPTFGTKTFGASVADGRDNLGNCVAGSDCKYNDAPSVKPSIQPGEAGYDDYFVIFGYSQSAVVASLVKADMIADPEAPDEASFVLLSNPMRPNGGILMKSKGLTIPIIDIPMYGATPTNTTCEKAQKCYPTVDIAQQYDLLGGDAPNNLFNLLALANSLAAYLQLHGAMADQNFGNAFYQSSYGDTDYFLNPVEIMPLLQPLQTLGVPRSLLLVANAPLQVLVESAYRRDINPGEPTPRYLIPISNPIALATNLLTSIPVGIDDGFEEASGPGVRPLGTTHAGRYGVGGEDTDLKGLPAGLIPLGPTDGTPTTVSDDTTTLDNAYEVKPTGVDDAGVVPAVTPERPKAWRPKVRRPISFDRPKLGVVPDPDGVAPEGTAPAPTGTAPDQPQSERPQSDHPTPDRPSAHRSVQRGLKALTGQRPKPGSDGAGQTRGGKHRKPDVA